METRIRKYWSSLDKRSTVGSWDLSTPDRQIWSELLKRKDFKGENKFSAGSIEVKEMYREGCWQPWYPISFKED